MQEETLKACTGCGETKPLSEYFRNKASKDGHFTKCKVCYRTKQKEYESTERGLSVRRAATRKHNQKRKHTAKHKAYERARQLRRRAQEPEKYAARTAVGNAVMLGNLPRVTQCQCDSCGRQAEEYHHHNGYSSEHALDVVPLCRECHRKAEAVQCQS
jgi:hypothetical protein